MLEPDTFQYNKGEFSMLLSTCSHSLGFNFFLIGPGHLSARVSRPTASLSAGKPGPNLSAQNVLRVQFSPHSDLQTRPIKLFSKVML